ncbi:MAG TPA: NADH-ubiquinone oxidoreductase-F iron-sulfur binding region domain-containing protein [Ktedonobacterales bacterium]|nr:NADH-ubiquinone oxidoreductase-F iron-sulfur binding region domain-containing protein [Ktedonobacterales bacterium]
MSDGQNRLLGSSDTAITTFADYTQQGGYAALRQALASMTPEQVIGEIRAANLRGRGGAGVLAAEKLSLVARADAERKYLVCNAYDADPRSRASETLLERNPFLVLEGMALAAFAIGVQEGYLYVRSTRRAAAEAVQAALHEALEQGALGRDIFGTPFEFSVNLVGVERGFMGGEESSLLEIIKGRPLKAQQRPPYPTEYGLGGHPTVVQNVETLANLPEIVMRGGQAFLASGTQATPGTKLVTVYGPGGDAQGTLVEVAFGTPLRQILQRANVQMNDSTARAVAVGGQEGGVLPLNLLDTPLDYEPLEEAGTIVGSSLLEVVPRDTCMVQWTQARTSYLADQTCGKCVPCRIGVKRVATLLEALTSGLGTQDDLAVLTEMSEYIPDGSLCGFGVNAVNPVITAMKYFGEDFTAHIEGRCPTGTCTPIRAHRYATKHVL